MLPALAVARALRDARPGLEVDFIGGARGMERRLLEAEPIAYHQLWVRSLRTARADLHLVADPLRLAASVPQAWRLLGRLRPAALFTTGGYLAIPLVVAARARGIPTLLWEGNVIPGRSTSSVARLATRVAVAFPPAAAAFGARAFVSGTPIRSLAGIDRGVVRASFGVGPQDRLLLIFGGSQAVARVDAALDEALPGLLAAWQVLHLTGERGLASAEARRDRLPAELRERYRPIAFLAEGMADALVAADLVVGRAGSSTCAEVAAAGVASILVPYPHAGRHQRANARWMADAGAALVVEDADLDAARLLAEVGALCDDGRRAALARAAAGLARPDAARVLAEALLALADRQPLPTAGQ